MRMMRQQIVQDNQAGTRVDVLVAELEGVSRSRAAKLVQEGHVLVNGRPTKPGYALRSGDRITVHEPPPEPSGLQPEEVPFQVMYQDADLIVLNKPRGVVVHPGAGHSHATLVHGLMALGVPLSGIGGVERPGIVHRLDRDTSGVMVVATNDTAHRCLQAQIQARTARREYVALVWGNPTFHRAVVEAAIGRDPEDRTRMAVLPLGAAGARPAVTELKVIERYGIAALLEAKLQTGRTHQIRVHCAYAGHPVLGDPVYGSRRLQPSPFRGAGAGAILQVIARLNGQALHARRLSFRHPTTGEHMEFEAPLPRDMEDVRDALREWAARQEDPA